jgi:hypothetical protein
MEREELAAHARSCAGCGALLVVAREVVAGAAAARAAVDAVEPRSYVRDFERLVRSALDEHRRALAELFYEVGKAYVYESSGERLKIVALKPPGQPQTLRARAKETFEGAGRLAGAPPAWLVEGELLRLTEPADPEAMVQAAGRFLEAALRMEPGHESATSWLASQRQATGRAAEARGLFEWLAHETTTSFWRAVGLMNLGRLSGSTLDFACAIASTTLARDLEPSHPAPPVNLALYGLYIGDLRLARSALAALENIVESDESVHRALRLGLFSESSAVLAVRRGREAWMQQLEKEYPTLLPPRGMEPRKGDGTA